MLRSNAAEEELRRPTLDTIMSSPRKQEDRGDRSQIAIPQRGIDQSSVGTANATPSHFTERSLQPEVDGSSDPECEEEGMQPHYLSQSVFDLQHL